MRKVENQIVPKTTVMTFWSLIVMSDTESRMKMAKTKSSDKVPKKAKSLVVDLSAVSLIFEAFLWTQIVEISTTPKVIIEPIPPILKMLN